MTIPINELVNVSPGVLSAAGAQIATTGLVLTTNTRVPIGTVPSFPNAAAVSAYFGSGSKEATIAGGGSGLGTGYFGGFTGATQIPAAIIFAQYNPSAVSAYLRSGNISGLTLAQIQAISGVLDILIDGAAHNAASLNLSAATSFSNAASIIATAINGSLPTLASVTGSIAPETAVFTATIAGNVMTVTAVASGIIVNGGSISGTGVSAAVITGQLSGTTGGIGTYAVSVSQIVASTTVTEAYGLLTVTAVGSGSLAVGQVLAGTDVTSGTQITQFGNGTGANGTYYVNDTETVGSETITATGANAVVSYDSTSGAFIVASGIVGAASTIAFAGGSAAAPLLLTSATGAITSQGAAPATPGAFMDSLLTVNPNWVGFMTAFDPDGGSGNAQKQAFAAWKNSQKNRFAYVCFDNDITATNTLPATSSLGYILNNDGDSGTCLIWEPTDLNQAAFILGSIAAINFNQTNGRISFAWKMQAGLVAGVTDPTVAANLGGNPQAISSFGNGYNFYGAYGPANPTQVSFQRGFVTGTFQWLDSYINAIWFAYGAQQALVALESNSNSIPYDTAGYTQIENALADQIQAALNFGMFAPPPPGTLSQSQINAVNAAAGKNIASALQQQGYYLLIQPASPSIRNSRTSPVMTFYYVDLGSIQALNLSSIALN